MSKFFWHTRQIDQFGKLRTPYEGDYRVKKKKEKAEKEGKPFPPILKCDDMEAAVQGWAAQRALLYCLYLCGENCMGGFHAAQQGLTIEEGAMTLDHIEAQAAYNLRNSFAVVGLLHKTYDFYEMVTKRVFYMDTSLNPTVEGKRHASGKGKEPTRCRDIFNDPAFQQQLVDRSPEIAALYRLYQVAVEVNAFQEKELQQCIA